MAANKDMQAQFMEALNELKEYAKVNGSVITKEDVLGFLKGIDIDEAKLNMVYGYLMANSIKVTGADETNNEFMSMMDNASPKKSIDLLSEEDYIKDEEYVSVYLKDLEKVEELSDTGRAFLLMNIVEDRDKESLKLLSESFLRKIVEWIEPFRRKGVLSSDLIQEANLAMMGYISEQRFLNNYEWKDKIKEGSTTDLLEVLAGIEKEVQDEIKGSLSMFIDEQTSSNEVANKVLGKVNLVNDWAVRLKEELGRKPTATEVAEKMGVSKETVLEAIQLSAENIEDIAGDK